MIEEDERLTTTRIQNSHNIEMIENDPQMFPKDFRV